MAIARSIDARNNVINRCSVTSCWLLRCRDEKRAFPFTCALVIHFFLPILPLITHTMRIINYTRLLTSSGLRATYISLLRLNRPLKERKYEFHWAMNGITFMESYLDYSNFRFIESFCSWFLQI